MNARTDPELLVPAAVDAVAVQGLTVEFPTLGGQPHVALRDLDLSIRAGEVVGLVGESGAGKSTLARSMLGLPPEPGRIVSGRVLLDGRDVLALPEGELRRIRGKSMAMVVPNPRRELDPTRRVGDQIATVAMTHLGLGPREARERAMQMLRDVQIPDPERRYEAYPHELSGGMAQRIVIAVALVCEPRFLVADDATSGLDVTVQAQILKLLRRLCQERGTALLFITRDISIAAQFCDRTAVMYQGELVEVASREDLFLRPRHPYTVMLLAAFAYQEELRVRWATPHPIARDEGCTYASRCPRAQERCGEQRPELLAATPVHLARCLNPVPR